jgi:hypothetical protein
LKNKKGSKQQKFIKTVTHQVKNAGQKVKVRNSNKKSSQIGVFKVKTLPVFYQNKA